MIDLKTKKVFLVGNMMDKQSASYILQSLLPTECRVAPFDNRIITKHIGSEKMNEKLVVDVGRLKPDMLLVLKGLDISRQALLKLKGITTTVCWIFDVTIDGVPVEEHIEYLDKIKLYDYFFTISRGSVKKLRDKGVNAYWLPEACFPQEHGRHELNFYQEGKYGADISFLGTVGFKNMHTNRIPMLQRVIKEFPHKDIKIYGGILNEKDIPKEIMKRHTKFNMINMFHSFVCQSSKIVIGMCGWPEVELSQSARVYRTLNCGAFYLTNYITNYEKMFNIDESGTPHFVVYRDLDDLVAKIKKYLPLEGRRKDIGKKGMEIVMKEHTFKQRLQDMAELVFGGKERWTLVN